MHKIIFLFRKTGFKLTSTYKLPVNEQLGHKVVLPRSSRPPMNIKPVKVAAAAVILEISVEIEQLLLHTEMISQSADVRS